MPFDINSLEQAQLDELLEDHKMDLNAYLTKKIARRRPVSHRKGAVYRFETPLGMAANSQRSVKHAPGAPTPQGNTELDTRGYKIDSFSWKEGIDHLSKQELDENLEEALKDITGTTAHTVMAGLDRETANILKGNGSAATNDDLTEKAAPNEWDDEGATSKPTDDVDDVVKVLRPGARGLLCVCGYDVALALSKNVNVVNNNDHDYTDFVGVRNWLRSRGVTEIFIDVGVQQDGEREAPRAYSGIFDGVFYIGTADNLILPEMNDISPDIYENPDTRQKFFRSAGDWDVITGYKAHGYYFTGILTAP